MTHVLLEMIFFVGLLVEYRVGFFVLFFSKFRKDFFEKIPVYKKSDRGPIGPSVELYGTGNYCKFKNWRY